MCKSVRYGPPADNPLLGRLNPCVRLPVSRALHLDTEHRALAVYMTREWEHGREDGPAKDSGQADILRPAIG